MELLCCEGEQLKRAYMDPVFLKDDRVLENLLKLEDYYTVSSNYMDFQTDIKPYMRKVVTEWMLEVCEEQRCEEEVFSLAVNFMDRFLVMYPELKRSRLQLLSTACLFLASKLKETYPLSAEKLVIYTDNSVSLQELLNYELLVLCKLKWDLSAVIPNDFLDLLLDRLSLPAECSSQVRRLALVNIALSTLELESVLFPPSMIAAGCICAALDSITSTRRTEHYQTLHRIAHLDKDLLKSCHEHIQRIIRNRSVHARAESESKDEPVSHPGTPTDALSVMVV